MICGKPPTSVSAGGSRDKRDFRNAPGLGLLRSNVHAALQATRELHRAVAQRKQRIVSAAAHVVARVDVGAALPDDDRPGRDVLTGETLDAETLGL